MPRYQRVLLLTTDATSDEFMTPGNAPHFSELRQTGIHCARTYAHGNPTQFSFPTIMTSTLPLDFGGYDWGIRARPATLAESLNANGMRTFGISATVWMSSLFDYTRGFDQFWGLHNPVGSWEGSLRLYVQYWYGLMASGQITVEECYQQVSTLLQQWFPYLIAHAAGDIEAAGEVPVLNYRDLGWEGHMRGVLSRLRAEFDRFSRSPEAYVSSNLPRLSRCDLRTYLKISPAHGPANFVPAKYTFRLILNLLRQHSDVPVFVWGHFRDVHDYFNLPQALDRLKGERTRARALRFWDFELGRFLAVLRDRGLWEDTLVVVHSDHGSGESCTLDEWALRVPLVFWSYDIETHCVDSLVGLIDLAPTILALSEIQPPGGFRGTSVLSLNSGDSRILFAEHAGRGPCDLPRKRIRIAVSDGTTIQQFEEDEPGGEVVRSGCDNREAKCEDGDRQWVSYAAAQCREIRRQAG
jgi:hypothetical protein